MAEDYVESSKEESGYGAQLSVKFGNGGMINVRTKDVATLAQEVNALGEVATFLVSTAEEVQAAATLSQQFAVTPVTQAPQAAPAPSYGVGSGAQGRMCAHGVAMAYRDGEKNGKRWSGYFCVVKNDPTMRECPAQFNR